MKIAVTYENGEVFQHFSDTDKFKIYKTDGKRITACDVIGTFGRGHSSIADFLKAENIDVLICGGIGSKAREAITDAKIKLCCEVGGNCDAVVEAFLADRLTYSAIGN